MATTTPTTTAPMTFAHWIKAVDAACQRRTGLSIHDLSDICYSDLYEDGFTPSQAAARAIRYQMGEE